MGSGEVAAVCDAEPLIHLAEIDCLGLLSVFGSLHIPKAVWLEVVRQRERAPSEILTLGNVQRHSLRAAEVRRFVEESALESLDLGERECLYLCHKMGIEVLLTDDLLVREAAKRVGLTPVGSLGIVARAYRMGALSLSTAEQHMATLYQTSSLFVTRTIVEMATEQLHRDAQTT